MNYFALIAALAVTIYLYRQTKPELSVSKKILLAALRFIAVSIILILLFNPIFNYVTNKEVKSRQIILLDDSESMQEKSKTSSKFDIARNAALALQEYLEDKDYEAEIYRFSSQLNGDHNSSKLAVTLQQLQEKKILQNVTDINIFSDGWLDDSNPDFIDHIRIPVNTYNLDFNPTGFDLELSDIRYNQKTWLKEITPFLVDVSATDFSSSAKIDFFIENKLIESKDVDFSSSSYQQLLFEYEFTDTGFKEIYFEISSDSLGELNTANNIKPGAVMVVPDKAKITLISDKMTWDGRFIVQSVKSNERFDIDYLLKGNRLTKQNITVNLREQIADSKVICLINNGSLHFNNAEAKLIRTFVEQGGGIFWMGKPIEELNELLPAKQSGIARSFQGKFLLTEIASQFQTLDLVNKFADEIPPVRFYYTSAKIGTKILAEFDDEQNPPAILFQEFYDGKILQFSLLDLYKWQLWGSKNHYHSFINQSMQWLSSSKSENFYVFSDQKSYLMGEDVNIILNAYDEKFAPVTDLKAQINIKLDDNSIIEDFMTRDFDKYSYKFSPEKPGNYSIEVNSADLLHNSTTEFVVAPANAESRDRGVNSSLLSFIAEQTGGKFMKDDDFNENIPKAEISYKSIRHEIPVYKKWYTLALFLLTFSLEIFLRKRWGLL